MKLKINHERISVTYKEVLDNIQELKELRALPDFLIIDDVGGCFGDDGCCCGGDGSGGFVQNRAADNVQPCNVPQSLQKCYRQSKKCIERGISMKDKCQLVQ